MPRTRGAIESRKASRSVASHNLCSVNAFANPSTIVCFGARIRTSALSPAIMQLLHEIRHPEARSALFERIASSLPPRTRGGDGRRAAHSYKAAPASQGRGDCRLRLFRVAPCNIIGLPQSSQSKVGDSPRARRLRASGRKRMASVSIREVRKAFGATEVIHGVDIDIGDGEFVVLVGPSGCGKS